MNIKKNRRSVPILTASGLVIFLGLIAGFQNKQILGQEQSQLIAVATPQGVYLRWKIPQKFRNNPIYIYRERSDRSQKILLTETPLQKAKTVEEIRKIVGVDWDRMTGKIAAEGLFIQVDPNNKVTWEQKEKELVEKFFGDSSSLDIVSLFYPNLARALNTTYVDEKTAPNINYTYSLVLGTSGSDKKMLLKTVNVNSSEIPEVNVPKGISGEPLEKMARVSWENEPNSTGIIGYNIYRNESETGIFKKVNQSPIIYSEDKSAAKKKDKPFVVYEDIKIDVQKKYWYYVTSVHFAGIESKPSMKVTVKPHASKKPDPVSVIKATLEKNGIIKVRWQPTTNKMVSYYDIYRSLDQRDGYKKINEAAIPANVSIYEDRLQDVGDMYYYKIKSLTLDKIESEFSAVLSCQITRETSPARLQLLKAESRGKKIYLEWERSKDPYISHYEVYRTQSRTTQPISQGHIKKEFNFFEDPNVNEGVTYYYHVTIRDKWMKESPASNQLIAKLADTQPPAAPVGFHAIVVDNVVRLRWKPVMSYNLAGFHIYRSTAKQPNMARLTTKMLPTTINEYEDVVDPAMGQIKYYITGVAAVGAETEKVGPAIASAWDPEPIEAPKNVMLYHKSADKSNTKFSIYIRWKKIYHKNLGGYLVFRKKVLDQEFTQITAKAVDTKQEIFEDKNVEANVVYQYYVLAIDLMGNKGKMSPIQMYEIK